MDAVIDINSDKEKSKSSILSILLFLLLLVALVIPIFSYQIPPPIQEGVLVSFGEPDKGKGSDAPAVQKEDPDQKETESSAAKEVEETKELQKEKIKPAVAKPASKVLTTKVEKEVIVPKSTEKSASKTPIKKPKVDLAVQRLLEEQQAKAAAAKAAAEKAEQFEKSKKQFGDFLSGSGKGNTGSTGNQGDPQGDPNAEILTGISKGTGRVGGGLSSRGVLYEPEIIDDSQEDWKNSDESLREF